MCAQVAKNIFKQTRIKLSNLPVIIMNSSNIDMQQALDDLDKYDYPSDSGLLRELASRVEAIEKDVKRLAAMEKTIQTILERTTPKSPCLFCSLQENRDGHFLAAVAVSPTPSPEPQKRLSCTYA
ncbi:unnamed protein product [Heligmosomoides polygyrus]|uniref:GED domain-containing protein n=1 Tax=Heligmosomoides polygyrus TaxID=6339 RepID=A0A183FFM5_HELPZ|nr:unnamed protein product [Heligmosomoides polygyrus]